MKKTERTAEVSDIAGCIMPYFRETSILRSSIIGNHTLVLGPAHLSSSMSRSQALWEWTESTESPMTWVLSPSKSALMAAKVLISVVHTGVKSAGWEKRMTHFPL